MLPGYNHNVNYQDSIYHVQTEDSGVANPHIITHLFVGGNIIESRKTSYADIVKNARLKELLVDLMQEQHKTMLKDLISGNLDGKIRTRSVNAAQLSGPAPLNVAAGGQARASLWTGTVGAKAPAALKPLLPKPALATPAPASSFFGSAPTPDQVIEAETLRKAFESKNQYAVDSIFGEDLISEKSLDEVILSYLAEDMQKE